MIIDARLADAWMRLPDYLGSHVLVSLTALAIGLGISLPVAVASRHRPFLRGTLLAAASIVQTLPGLALLALFYTLPLALPVIMAGIRTSAVWVIGTATLATPIGQTSLGNYIFTGLQTQNWVFVIFGCIAAAVLALAVDQMLALIQVGVGRRSRWRTMLGAIGIAALVAATL